MPRASMEGCMGFVETGESFRARVLRLAADAQRNVRRAQDSQARSRVLVARAGEADVRLTSSARGVRHVFDAERGDLARALRRVHGRELPRR